MKNYPNFREGKKTLVVKEKKGQSVDVCATISDRYICCNVHVLKSVSNCPFECSYCFLQNYLNDGTNSVVTDTDGLMQDVYKLVNANTKRFFRIGTWELGDSLALENLVESAPQLINAFSNIENAVLELKTKSDRVDTILGLNHKDKTVVSWSMNPQAIIKREEHLTARLPQRLEAVRKVIDSGYPVGFHFDPMIHFEGWEQAYTELVEQIFEIVPNDRIAWLSIGSLRFNPEMKKNMDINYPGNQLTSSEMVVGKDRKVRYIKPLRIEMYQHIYKRMRQLVGTGPLVYLCMEADSVWEKVMGYSPSSIEHLDYMMAESMHQRFPKMNPLKPLMPTYGVAPLS